MYTTIEANIKQGKLVGPEVDTLPDNAHVLVTLLDNAGPTKRPAVGVLTSKKIEMAPDALMPLNEAELKDWGL